MLSKIEEYEEEMAYRFYITDALKLTCENTAKISGGTFLSTSFKDIVLKKPEDTRTGEEIIADIKYKLEEGSEEA